jgi:hypothetical protein
MAREINHNYKYKDVVAKDEFTYSILPKHGQFKGNQCELGHTKMQGGNQQIHLFNSYYNGFARQTYSITNSLTTSIFSFNIMLPKYLRNKIAEMSKYMLENTRQRVPRIDQFVMNIPNLSITMNEYVFNIESSYTTSGFAFKNNQHSIQEIKKLQELMKKVKRVFKYNTCKEIYQAYTKSSLEERKYDPDHSSNNIYLDFNKFIKLKQE